jgi:hypothetical protein
VTICPCCGFKFTGTLTDGCARCGARAVGDALPKPAHELPSYGRTLILVVSGSLLTLVLFVQTIIALAQRPGSLGRFFQFWSWVAAGETAAWRLKWVSIPVLFVALFFGLKLYRSIRLQPRRFCGVKYARRGLLASSTVGLLIALLIGVTVPARLRQRQMSIDAKHQARAYTLMLALYQYRKTYKQVPDQGDIKNELARLPDPYGLIKDALANMDPTGYQPKAAEIATNTTQQRRGLRGEVIRKVSMTSPTDDLPAGGLAFTDYDLRLPGEDKILGNGDDWIGRDGVIMKLADVANGGVGRSVSAGILNP